jgi:hypothetical protein
MSERQTSVNTSTSPPVEQRPHEAMLLLILSTRPAVLKASWIRSLGMLVWATRQLMPVVPQRFHDEMDVLGVGFSHLSSVTNPRLADHGRMILVGILVEVLGQL